jgi:hypothetical protein
MLLHNQRGARVSWEANGQVFAWEPYGSCEIPDVLVAHIKSEGFPVSVNPVAPKERAERAAAETTESQQALELAQLRKDLDQAKTQLRDAIATAEASDLRANAVRAEADGAAERARVLEQEVAGLRKDAAEYEKLLAESATQMGKLREQLKLEQAKAPEAQKKK